MAGDPRGTHRWKQITKRMRATAGDTCPRCGTAYDRTNPRSRDYPTVDHTTALALGGDPYDTELLRVICNGCNASLGATLGNRLRRAVPSRAWHSNRW